MKGKKTGTAMHPTFWKVNFSPFSDRRVVVMLTLVLSVAGCTATSTSRGLQPETVNAPIAEPLPSELCGTDAALLSVYPIDFLYGTPLPPACCESGVLPEEREWLCEHDWPSSDVPLCSEWQTLARELHIFRSNPPAWIQKKHKEVGQENMRVLLQWADQQMGCQPDTVLEGERGARPVFAPSLSPK